MRNQAAYSRIRRLVFLTAFIIPAALIAMPRGRAPVKAEGSSNTNRILKPASPRPGQVPGLASQSTYLGALRADDVLRMTVAFQAANTAALRQTISDLYNPASSRFHQWLSPEEFGRLCGRSPAEMQQASAWLSAQGFKIDQTWPNNLAITFTGRVAEVEHAFNVTMGRYHNEKQNSDFYANDADAVLPPELSDITVELRGMNNAYRYQTGKTTVRGGPVTARRMEGRVSGATDRLPATEALLDGTFVMGPADLQLAYDINDPTTGKAVTNPGQGQTAAIIIDSGLSQSDIDDYRKDLGLAQANVKQVAAPGTQLPLAGQDGEAALDYDAISCIAPEAEIVLVLAPNLTQAAVFAAEQYCINILMPTAINESFGLCEAESFSTAEQTLFQQGVAEGIAIVASSGDDDDQCVTNGYESGVAMDSCPAAYAEVTAVGGTEYPGPLVLSPSGTLLGVSNETVWNIPPGLRLDCLGDSAHGASTGTGISVLVAMPEYQSGAIFAPGGVPSGVTGRIVPDLVMNADPDSNGLLVVYDGGMEIFGGTSLSSPETVAMLCLLNQQKAARLGSPNTELYRLGARQYSNDGPTVFIDITSGDNAIGPMACYPNGLPGQTAGFGFDLASGWGALDWGQLATYYGASSLPQRPSPPPPPALTQVTARLVGNVLTVQVLSNSQGLNVDQAAYQLLNGTGDSVASGSMSLRLRHSVSTAYVLSIPGLSNLPAAVSVSLTETDQFGGASTAMTANFADADPGGADLTSATFNGKEMTVKGKGLSGKLSLEVNGKIVATGSGSGKTAAFKGNQSSLNLQSGANRIRVAGGAANSPIFSNIFIYMLQG
jgi:subtilase family serine protease